MGMGVIVLYRNNTWYDPWTTLGKGTMGRGPFDDQVWDESRWEAHIDDLEDKSRRLKRFITPHGDESNPRWLFLLRDYESELEVVDTFVMEELIFEEAYFPEDEEDEWDDEQNFWKGLEESDQDEEYFLPDDYWDEEDIEGEEWKKISDEYRSSANGSIESLDFYVNARHNGAFILAKARSMDPSQYSIEFIRLVDAILKVATKIVAGYALGFEKDLMGGNIVYNKKALRWANCALDLLHSLKRSPMFVQEEYFELHESIFENRNELGIYVQELRERFHRM